MKTYTAAEAAKELGINVSRVQRLCKDGRLGYSTPKHGRAYVITAQEIARYRAIGPLASGRPPNAKE